MTGPGLDIEAYAEECASLWALVLADIHPSGCRVCPWGTVCRSRADFPFPSDAFCQEKKRQFLAGAMEEIGLFFKEREDGEGG